MVGLLSKAAGGGVPSREDIVVGGGNVSRQKLGGYGFAPSPENHGPSSQITSSPIFSKNSCLHNLQGQTTHCGLAEDTCNDINTGGSSCQYNSQIAYKEFITQRLQQFLVEWLWAPGTRSLVHQLVELVEKGDSLDTFCCTASSIVPGLVAHSCVAKTASTTLWTTEKDSIQDASQFHHLNTLSGTPPVTSPLSTSSLPVDVSLTPLLSAIQIASSTVHPPRSPARHPSDFRKASATPGELQQQQSSPVFDLPTAIPPSEKQQPIVFSPQSSPRKSLPPDTKVITSAANNANKPLVQEYEAVQSSPAVESPAEQHSRSSFRQLLAGVKQINPNDDSTSLSCGSTMATISSTPNFDILPSNALVNKMLTGITTGITDAIAAVITNAATDDSTKSLKPSAEAADKSKQDNDVTIVTDDTASMSLTGAAGTFKATTASYAAVCEQDDSAAAEAQPDHTRAAGDKPLTGAGSQGLVNKLVYNSTAVSSSNKDYTSLVNNNNSNNSNSSKYHPAVESVNVAKGVEQRHVLGGDASHEDLCFAPYEEQKSSDASTLGKHIALDLETAIGAETNVKTIRDTEVVDAVSIQNEFAAIVPATSNVAAPLSDEATEAGLQFKGETPDDAEGLSTKVVSDGGGFNDTHVRPFVNDVSIQNEFPSKRQYWESDSSKGTEESLASSALVPPIASQVVSIISTKDTKQTVQRLDEGEDQNEINYTSTPLQQTTTTLTTTLPHDLQIGGASTATQQPVLLDAVNNGTYVSTSGTSGLETRVSKTPMLAFKQPSPFDATSDTSISTEFEIPKFYQVPNSPSDKISPSTRARIEEAFVSCPNGLMDVNQFENEIVVPLLGLSRYFSRTLFGRINTNANSDTITLDNLLEFWRNRYVLDDPVSNFFYSTKEDVNDFIWRLDFDVFLSEMLDRHPGMEFLKGSPDFQTRYMETVVGRIFYVLDPHASGHITLSDLRNSNLPTIWTSIDQESDLNNIRDFFCYEHFYVIYCKFWELDSDHDFRLDKQDLLRHDQHAFSHRAVDRIMTVAGEKFSSGSPDLLNYEDFIHLLMNDEDKTSERSIDFWFKIVDIDGDGVIRDHEMLYFYDQQCERLEALCAEIVSFEDLICQMNDLLLPRREGQYTLADFKKNKRAAGLFFNMLLSLTKFVTYEQRDPFQHKQDVLDLPEHLYSDWDRFCRREYTRLATDEECDEWEELQSESAPSTDPEEMACEENNTLCVTNATNEYAM